MKKGFVFLMICLLAFISHNEVNMTLENMKIISNNFFNISSDTIFIKEDYNLNGQVFDIPDGKIIIFKGGSIHNGRLNLGNNTKIIGGSFYNYGNINYYRKSRTPIGYCASISVIGSQNVEIYNCEFHSSDNKDPFKRIGIIVYGSPNLPSSTVKIDYCKLFKSSIEIFSNSSNVQVTNSEIISDTHLMSIETLYDEYKGKYFNPINIYLANNHFVADNSNVDEPPLWFSGIENVTFENNYCESDCNILQLYCGDGNIALDSININNNDFVFKRFNIKKKNACAINCMGRSYSYMVENKSFGLVEIKGNRFYGLSVHNHLNSCRAISSRFLNNILIKENYFYGFDDVIYLGDNFKNIMWVTTNAIIENNEFKYYKHAPFLIDSQQDCIDNTNLKSLSINNNKFFDKNIDFKIIKYKNCNYNKNTFVKDEISSPQ